MPLISIDEQRKKLVEHIDAAIKVADSGEKLNDHLRWLTRGLKVLAALLTSVAAIVTGITGFTWAAWVTAGAGILTAMIEVIGREFMADKLRAHYFWARLEYRHLLQRIELETDWKEELVRGYLNEFHQLETKEAETRPTMARLSE